MHLERKRSARVSAAPLFLACLALITACGDASRPEVLAPELDLAAASTPAGLYLTPDSAFIQVGTAQQFTATVLDSVGDTLSVYVSFTIEDTAVAAVDTTGLVTGLAPGSTVLRAATSDGLEDLSFVAVYQADPATRLATLIDAVEALAEQGVFRGQQGRGLLAKLNEAASALAADDPAGAIGALSDFVSQARAVLSTRESQPLIDLAESIIDQLGA